jgi:hypothetical protein
MKKKEYNCRDEKELLDISELLLYNFENTFKPIDFYLETSLIYENQKEGLENSDLQNLRYIFSNCFGRNKDCKYKETGRIHSVDIRILDTEDMELNSVIFTFKLNKVANVLFGKIDELKSESDLNEKFLKFEKFFSDTACEHIKNLIAYIKNNGRKNSQNLKNSQRYMVEKQYEKFIKSNEAIDENILNFLKTSISFYLDGFYNDPVHLKRYKRLFSDYLRNTKKIKNLIDVHSAENMSVSSFLIFLLKQICYICKSPDKFKNMANLSLDEFRNFYVELFEFIIFVSSVKIGIYGKLCDIYTICRIFRSFSGKNEKEISIVPRNIIIYAGDAHVKNMIVILKEVFKMREHTLISEKSNIGNEAVDYPFCTDLKNVLKNGLLF